MVDVVVDGNTEVPVSTEDGIEEEMKKLKEECKKFDIKCKTKTIFHDKEVSKERVVGDEAHAFIGPQPGTPAVRGEETTKTVIRAYL